MGRKEEEEIITVVGTFSNNFITTDTGEKIHCRTYGSVRSVIEGQQGVYNLKWDNKLKGYVLFQYILLNENIDLE